MGPSSNFEDSFEGHPSVNETKKALNDVKDGIDSTLKYIKYFVESSAVESSNTSNTSNTTESNVSMNMSIDTSTISREMNDMDRNAIRRIGQRAKVKNGILFMRSGFWWP